MPYPVCQPSTFKEWVLLLCSTPCPPRLLFLFTFSSSPVCPECLSRSLHVPPRSSESLSGPSLCSRVGPQGCLFWFPRRHHLTQQVPRFCSASSSTAPTHSRASACVLHPASSNCNLTPSPRTPLRRLGITTGRSSSGPTSQLLTGKTTFPRLLPLCLPCLHAQHHPCHTHTCSCSAWAHFFCLHHPFAPAVGSPFLLPLP